MSFNTPGLHPPLLAAWLIELFDAGQAEAITGDLLEEFLGLAAKSGVAYARRWYWRQSIKTVVDLIGAGFRTAPWLIAGTVIGGYLLLALALGYSLPERLIVAVLDLRRHRVIPYYSQHEMDAHVFWLNTGTLIGNLLISLFVGCIVAVVAKTRELVATVTLGVLLFALTVVAWFNVARHWPEHTIPLPIMLINLAHEILIPIGGVMVRQVRRTAGRWHSSA